MPDLADILRGGGGWLYPSLALLLGALHGLEPGHSRTMVTASVAAIRGSVGQAVLLGLTAALSRSLVIWAAALVGLTLGRELLTTRLEGRPIATGALVLAVAGWMVWRSRRDLGRSRGARPPRRQSHADEVRVVDTGRGRLEVVVDGAEGPPRWRLRALDGPLPAPSGTTLDTRRPDGTRDLFRFRPDRDTLVSTATIPEPHDFTARLVLIEGDDARSYSLVYGGSDRAAGAGGDLPPGALDPTRRERARAEAIGRALARPGATAATAGIAPFGLTGELIPCPAAVTVLLVGLQLGRPVLGIATIAAFSLGLAATMIAVGTAAACGAGRASRRPRLPEALLRRLPLVSAGIVAAIGLTMLLAGIDDLPRPAGTL